uniref:Odorant receptor n=1 Tax=Diabrotica virgifera virgifera TaxID=50390 RepID=A0A6P7GQE5_DIAVI
MFKKIEKIFKMDVEDCMTEASKLRGQWEKPEFMNFKAIISWNLFVLYKFGYMLRPFRNCMDFVWYLPKLGYICGVLVLQFTLEFMNFFYLENSVTDIVGAFFMTLVTGVQIIKLIFLYINMRGIEDLLQSINRPEFQPKSDYQTKILWSYILRSRIMLAAFWLAGVFTVATWIIFPLLEEEPKLPIEIWFPFDLKNTTNFYIAYAFVMFATFTNGIINMCIDTLLSASMMIGAAQFEILNDSLENIRYFSEEELKSSGKSINCRDKDEIFPELQEIMDQKFKECIEHHRIIIAFLDEYQNMFTYCLLVQFVSSVNIICVGLFELAQTELGSVQFFSRVGYQFCFLYEIFLMCYYGNEVTIQSNKLVYSAYHSHWIHSSRLFRKHLIYFMTRTQVTVSILAGRLFTLNLGSFVGGFSLEAS